MIILTLNFVHLNEFNLHADLNETEKKTEPFLGNLPGNLQRCRRAPTTVARKSAGREQL